MAKDTDQISIIKIINLYAHYADRRKPDKQSQLFTKNAVVEVYQGEPDTHKPVQILKGREELEKAFGELKNYNLTTHLNGQTNLSINGNSANGETYCVAHHLKTENGQRTLTVMYIRYYDIFVKEDNNWLFSERKLIIDWTDSRLSNP